MQEKESELAKIALECLKVKLDADRIEMECLKALLENINKLAPEILPLLKGKQFGTVKLENLKKPPFMLSKEDLMFFAKKAPIQDLKAIVNDLKAVLDAREKTESKP
ncbi:hypothetical protein ES702_00765 [subsurface metagenome]